ncbi:hypothetical protein DVT68_11720 [Dyella solisilvae]|uniref:Uncharacterized protein n=1 Tax=Dyella solisilvae TaxID=1920168 RepID=A0A370K9M0_9GAMM|nr:hypothetical protein [Dyella solisilvae]RDI99137.1 hypothetical protein DVT68_11720 [Dyella solisilvae]
MSLIKQLHAVRTARHHAQTARQELATPAHALLARGRQYPLTTVGVAAGAGFVLGQFDVHPLRVPGLGALLGGTAAEVVGQAARLVAEYVQDHFDTP